MEHSKWCVGVPEHSACARNASREKLIQGAHRIIDGGATFSISPWNSKPHLTVRRCPSVNGVICAHAEVNVLSHSQRSLINNWRSKARASSIFPIIASKFFFVPFDKPRKVSMQRRASIAGNCVCSQRCEALSTSSAFLRAAASRLFKTICFKLAKRASAAA